MGALSLGRVGGEFTELLAGRAASPRQQDVNAEQDTMLCAFPQHARCSCSPDSTIGLGRRSQERHSERNSG